MDFSYKLSIYANELFVEFAKRSVGSQSSGHVGFETRRSLWEG